MPGTIKKILIWMLLIWLVGLLITCIFLPRFHKSLSQPPEIPQAEPGSREQVLCVDDNQEALIRRLQIIESAKDNLILSAYYLGSDESGTDIMSALLNAADRGVRIRILADGFCNFTTLAHSKAFRALTESPQVEAKIYNPVNLFCPWQLNYRMHDKYMIADDQVYLLGGRNNRNVSLGTYPGKHDIDRDILVWSENGKGSLKQVRDYFEQVWALPECRPVKAGRKPHLKARQQLEKRYAELPELYPEAFREVDFQDITMPVNSITLLHNPVEAKNKEPVLWKTLGQYISQGQDILVQTPYIVCSSMMYDDLEQYSEAGKQVKIITNAPEYGANPCGCADFLNHRKKLARTGAEIWEYAGGQSSHTKTVLIDDRISIVGSFNFDMRSTYLDTEMMLAIDSPELNAHLREMDQEYLQQSRRTLESGELLTGQAYVEPEEGLPRKLLHTALRVITCTLRHLL